MGHKVSNNAMNCATWRKSAILENKSETKAVSLSAKQPVTVLWL